MEVEMVDPLSIWDWGLSGLRLGILCVARMDWKIWIRIK